MVLNREVPAITWPWKSGPAVPGTILSVCLSSPGSSQRRSDTANLLSASFTETFQASLLGSQLSQQQHPLFSISRPFPTTFTHLLYSLQFIYCVCVFVYPIFLYYYNKVRGFCLFFLAVLPIDSSSLALSAF